MTISKIKYPRTFHLPWSPGATSDDKIHSDLGFFEGQEVVVTEKMDGENTTIYADGTTHARSMDSAAHPSRSWVRAFAAGVGPNLPDGWRVCGENLYAQHSLAYEDLPSYFLGFSLWNEHNICLSWSDTVDFFAELGIEPVQELYRGIWDEEKIRGLVPGEKREGFVVRLAGSFSYEDFAQAVAKWVRAGHVQTDQHWMHQEVIPNGLR